MPNLSKSQMIKQHTKQKNKYINLRQIEKEFNDGNFKRLNYFLDNTTSQGIYYALECASFYGQLDIIKKIINFGIEINESIYKAIIAAINNNHYEIIELLMMTLIQMQIKKNTKYCTIIKNGALDLPLRISVENGNYNITKLLIDYGATINKNNSIIFLLAIKSRNLDIIKLLSSFGIDKNTLYIAIDCAKINNQNDIIEFLNTLNN